MERERAIETLPEPYAEALRLHEQRDDDEIPKRLGIEPEAVGPLLRLAEAKLSAAMRSGPPARNREPASVRLAHEPPAGD